MSESTMAERQSFVPDALADSIAARTRRHGGHVSACHLRYYNRYLYTPVRSCPARSVLYVGVGGGFDAILSLLDGFCESVVGVDPYIASDGNDDEDYDRLASLIDKLGLTERFRLVRGTIQDYIGTNTNVFDRIICNQVLHHIWQTRNKLRADGEFDSAVSLFGSLHDMLRQDGTLIVGEACRNGLRPLLSRLGLLKGSVNYATKQDWTEWDAAAREVGLVREALVNYVPFPLRTFAVLARGAIARATICETYILRYARSGTRLHPPDAVCASRS